MGGRGRLVGVDVGELVALQLFEAGARPAGVVALFVLVGPAAGLAEQVGDFVGVKVLCVFVGVDLLGGGVGAEVDAELVVRDAELIVGQQGGAADAGAVDAGAVGTAQVADEKQAVGLDNDAVHLGDALVLQAHVALFLAA